jgi:hypothetical protein
MARATAKAEVATMKMNAAWPVLVSLALGLSSCGGEEPAEPGGEALENPDAPVVTFTPETDAISIAGETGEPVSIAYRIIGAPVVGQPVAIDIQVSSSFGDLPVTVSYRINDATAMRLADAQPASVVYTPDADNELAPRQVTIVPLREGRLYLNVQASVDTRTGSLSTVTAIPLEVGEGA